jgi:hypothetical protein
VSWRRRRRGPPQSSWAGRRGSTDPTPLTEGAAEGEVRAAEGSPVAAGAVHLLDYTPAATASARPRAAPAEAAATADTTTTTATPVPTTPTKAN